MYARLRPCLPLLACLAGCGGGHGQFVGAPEDTPLEHGAQAPAANADSLDPDDARDPGDALDSADPADPGDAQDSAGPAPVPVLVPPVEDDTPTNLSFDTARELRVDDGVGLLQQVIAGDQLDHYRFEGEAGAFYVLTTNRGTFTPNNVITLYGPDREPLAENDHGALFAGDGIDARLVVRLQQGGTHYVVVEDRYTPDAYFEADTPVLFYRVTLARLHGSSPGFALADPDADPDADVDAQPIEVPFLEHDDSGFRYATLVGTLAPGSRDVFDFRGSDTLALIGHASVGGVAGNGSTSSGGLVEVSDAEHTVVARIDRGAGQIDIHPPVSEQAYQLAVDAADERGDNDFYAIDLVLLPDNPSELEDTANDDAQGAEPIAMEGTFRRRGLLLTHLPPGDVDHYSFEANEGESLLFSCEGQAAGSGLRGLSVELSDPDGNPLGLARETIIAGLLLSDVRAPATGTYRVRMSADAIDDEVDSDWARCVLIVEP